MTTTTDTTSAEPDRELPEGWHLHNDETYWWAGDVDEKMQERFLIQLELVGFRSDPDGEPVVCLQTARQDERPLGDPADPEVREDLTWDITYMPIPAAMAMAVVLADITGLSDAMRERPDARAVAVVDAHE